MSQMLQIHPETPQSRLVSQAVEVIERGGVVVYPTDSGYALVVSWMKNNQLSGFVVFASSMISIISP